MALTPPLASTPFRCASQHLLARHRLARTQGSSFARADASILFYVIDPTRLKGADWSVQDVLTPPLLSLLGAAAVYGATHLKISRRARLEPIPQPA